jgi:hypothetical protein
MRRPALAALLLALAATLGCGDADDDTTPVVCLSGTGPYVEALAAAPRAVRLDGEAAISDCLVENQSAADLEQLGRTLLRTTIELNAAARADPGGEPTVQLGYLIGAVQKGAEETGGIHAELARRLEGAALFSPAGKPPPPPFDQRYREGLAAGAEQG